MTRTDAVGTEKCDAVIELSLYGPFTLRDIVNGCDLTPKPHKVRALIALLMLSPDCRRSRRWIEERLWSDRGAPQAAGSLRQALVDLRKALGSHSAVLQADREWVSLDAKALDLLPANDAGGEFLEGVTVRDPSFLAWLECERQKIAGPGAPPGISGIMTGGPLNPSGQPEIEPITIRCVTSNAPGTGSNVVAEIIASRIATDIADHVTSCTVTRGYADTDGQQTDLEITCNVVEDSGICLAFIKIVHIPTHRVLFNKDCRFIGTATSLVGSEELICAAYEAAERVVTRAPHVLGVIRPVGKSTALGQLALHKMFSFDEAQLAEADRLMEQAYEVEGNAVHLAWRGLLQMVKAIELSQAQRPELHDMAKSLTANAMANDEGNSTVKALVSQTQAMLFGDAVAAGQAAQAALEENPRNPFALQAMAVAKMLAGDGEAAYQMSSLGRTYASRSSFRHWWDAHHATICVATNRVDEAISAAEAAAFGAPSLRPAYRYLLSLYAQRGELDRAVSIKEKLETIEPGFSLDRMLRDPDYPVRTLRNTGFLKALRKLM
ncbi:MAG: hypothetical protein ACK5M4_03545 [Pseudorhodobacter sp.]